MPTNRRENAKHIWAQIRNTSVFYGRIYTILFVWRIIFTPYLTALSTARNLAPVLVLFFWLLLQNKYEEGENINSKSGSYHASDSQIKYKILWKLHKGRVTEYLEQILLYSVTYDKSGSNMVLLNTIISFDLISIILY